MPRGQHSLIPARVAVAALLSIPSARVDGFFGPSFTSPRTAGPPSASCSATAEAARGGGNWVITRRAVVLQARGYEGESFDSDGGTERSDNLFGASYRFSGDEEEEDGGGGRGGGSGGDFDDDDDDAVMLKRLRLQRSRVGDAPPPPGGGGLPPAPPQEQQSPQQQQQQQLPSWVLEERRLAAERERLDQTAFKRKRAESKLGFATQADRRGDYRQSEQLLKEAVELYPYDGRLWRRLARLAKQWRRDDALCERRLLLGLRYLPKNAYL